MRFDALTPVAADRRRRVGLRGSTTACAVATAGDNRPDELTSEPWLEGWSVRIDGPAAVVRSACDVISPPCELAPAGTREPDWHLRVAVDSAAPEEPHPLEDRVTLRYPQGRPQVWLLDGRSPVSTLVGKYRDDAGLARLEVSATMRRTELTLPADDPLSARWPDWLLRLAFGSRLLAAGWQLVHASAVRLPEADGALVVLGGPAGGKSTIAHRACVELGAALLADDLVLLGPADHDGLIPVVGWPTRIGVPAELLSGDTIERAQTLGTFQRHPANGWTRKRLLLSPPAHRELLGVAHADPTALGGVLVIETGADTGRGVQRLAPRETEQALRTAAHPPGQRSLLTDPLGLMGGPRSIGDADEAPRPMESVPAACLRTESPASLGSPSLWDELAEFLTAVGGSR